MTNEIATQFLGQNIKSNTLEAQYDFSRRYSGSIGYLYTNRTISSMDADLRYRGVLFSGRCHRDGGESFILRRAEIAPLVGGALPAGLHVVNHRAHGRRDCGRFASKSHS